MEQEKINRNDIYDVIIIGGGPAGLTAGLYAARARLSNLLIERMGLGGQVSLTDKIENYPGFIEGIPGPELVKNMEGQARSFGMKIYSGDVSRIDTSSENNVKKVFIQEEEEPFRCLSVIIAAGNEQRKLGAPGEQEYTGKGVSYCATCDGAFFRGMPVAVIGGGDMAVEEAMFLTRFAEKVYIIHRRDRLRATKILHERAVNNDKIEFMLDSVVEEIYGQSLVDGVKVKSVKTGGERKLPVNGVFIFIGYKPNLSFLSNTIKTNEAGFIIVDREMKTSAEGIFACGDCCDKKLRQVVTACGDGATAAFSAQTYVDRLKGQEYI